MDDNKTNLPEIQSQNDIEQSPTETNQAEYINTESKPIFESVPVKSTDSSNMQNLQPEEVSPDIVNPTSDNMSGSGNRPEIPTDEPPMIYEENKNKYIIIIAASIFFFIILIFFIKVIFTGKKTPKQAKLVYWGLWEEKEVYNPLIEQYQQKNPGIKIDYQKMSEQEYRDKLLARSKNGQGPDIFRFHNTWLPEIRDLASPLPNAIMSNNEFEKTFYKIHQTDLKVDNYYYGLPLEIDGLVLIYNDGLLKKAGIDNPPITWDELTDIVTQLTVKDNTGQLITSGIAIGTASNIENFSDILGLMILQNGGSLKNLDQSEAIGALESFRRFAEPPADFWSENMPNSLTAFIQEKVAMIIAPSWWVLVIKNSNPDIQLKVSTVPSVPGSIPMSIANYWIEGVSKYSKNQLEAWKFLRYLIEKENMTKLYEAQSKIRLFGEPYSRVDLAPLLAQNEYIGPVIKQADNYVSIPVVSRTFDNGLNDEIIKYLENAVNSTIQGVSYEEALKQAKQGVDQVFSKFKIE